MSQTINRMYASFALASEAAEALRSHLYSRFTLVHVVGPNGRSAPIEGQAPLSHEEITAEVMKAYVLRAHARVLAHGIERGATLVTVHAAFGTAADAIDTLQAHGPIESGLTEPSWAGHAWDDAAPLSSLFGGIPVRLDNPTPFGSFWNLPSLISGARTTSSALGLPELSDSPAPLSKAVGVPVLSKFSLSQLLGLPLLIKSKSSR